MKILDWEIWHAYSSFFEKPISDLFSLAQKLILNEIAEFVCMSDNSFYWKNEKDFRSGKFILKKDVDSGKTKFNYLATDNKDLNLAPFPRECLHIASWMRESEHNFFGDDIVLKEPYLRYFSGMCRLINSSKNTFISCYPIVTVFSNGVITVHFRVIGPPAQPIELDIFIENHVNLFNNSFENVECPPSFGVFAPVASKTCNLDRMSIFNKIQTLKDYVSHKKLYEKTVRIEDTADFKYRLATLTKTNNPEILSNLALLIFSLVCFMLRLNGKTFSFRLFKQSTNQIGEYWSGRPYIFIVKHTNQGLNAIENFEKNKYEIACILARAYHKNMSNAVESLPENLRFFNDFNLFITSAACLWLWSKNGIKEQKEYEEPNRGHLIYSQFIISDTLEYGYMLYRATIQRISSFSNITHILSLRSDIAYLKSKLNLFGRSGEIRKVLSKGWDALDVPQLQILLAELIEIRETHYAWQNNKNTDRSNRILTILIGLFATPTVSTDLTKPLWEHFNLWLPFKSDLNNIFYIGMTLGLLLLIIILVNRLIKSKIK